MNLVHSETIKSYDTDTDAMRVIAAFFVVLLHASGTSTHAGIFFNSLSRFSVPVFVMLSGYYMLDRQAGMGRIVKKCGKMFGLMLAWSGVYYIYGLISDIHSYTGLKSLVVYLLTEPVYLWYIYAAIGLYLFTPLLYIFCRHATQKEYLYGLGLAFFFGSLVIILLRSGYVPTLGLIIDKMKAPYTLGFIFLYLLGGYLRRYGISQKSHRLLLNLLGLLGVAVTCVGTIMLSSAGQNKELLLSFFAPNVMAASAAFFVLCKDFFQRHPIASGAVRAWTRSLAGCTLGIYVLHPLFLMILRQSGKADLLFSPLYILPTSLAVFILSALIILVLKRIPVLNRLAG